MMNTEQSYKLRKVSGLDCIVQASIQKGKIVGCLSLKNESRPFRFEFSPMPTGDVERRFSEMNIEQELSRLSFEIEMDSEGRQHLKLVVNKTKGLLRFVFIGKLKGAMQNKSQVALELSSLSNPSGVTIKAKVW